MCRKQYSRKEENNEKNLKNRLTGGKALAIMAKHDFWKEVSAVVILDKGGQVICLFVPRISPLRQEETAAEQIGK